MDDNVDLLLPINSQVKIGALETVIATAINQVFIDELKESISDLIDYGTPHIGNRRVYERFIKQDGLVVLYRQQPTTDSLMRVIYATWLSLGSERGLSFLEFVLRLLWGESWSLVRLWHSKTATASYPTFCKESEQPNTFLTSRVRVKLEPDILYDEIAALAPVLKKIVPANVTLEIRAEALLDTDAGTTVFNHACGAKGVMVWDLS